LIVVDTEAPELVQVSRSPAAALSEPLEVIEGVSPETLQVTSRPVTPENLSQMGEYSHQSHWNGIPDNFGFDEMEFPGQPDISDDVPTVEHIEHRDRTPEAIAREEYNYLQPVYGGIIWAWARELRTAAVRSPLYVPWSSGADFLGNYDDLRSHDMEQVVPAVRRIAYFINLHRNYWNETPETEGNLYLAQRFRDLLYRPGLERERRLWEECVGFHLYR
jgi:hypothetical protein